MILTIMNTPGFMQEYKHSCDEEFDAFLPSMGCSIVTPPPDYALITTPCRLVATPMTEICGFQIQESSDAAADPVLKLPTESGTLCFSRLRILNTSLRS